jgi:hypothetical protein
VGDPYLSPRRNLLLKISNPNEQARLARSG